MLYIIYLVKLRLRFYNTVKFEIYLERFGWPIRLAEYFRFNFL